MSARHADLPDRPTSLPPCLHMYICAYVHMCICTCTCSYKNYKLWTVDYTPYTLYAYMVCVYIILYAYPQSTHTHTCKLHICTRMHTHTGVCRLCVVYHAAGGSKHEKPEEVSSLPPFHPQHQRWRFEKAHAKIRWIEPKDVLVNPTSEIETGGRGGNVKQHFA